MLVIPLTPTWIKPKIKDFKETICRQKQVYKSRISNVVILRRVSWKVLVKDSHGGETSRGAW